MSKVNIQNFLGLNTRDHPTEMGHASGVYLQRAVNVDITDKFSIQRRKGYSVVTTGLNNAHSLVSFLDRFAIYADGSLLQCYDTTEQTTIIIFSALTPNKRISYTLVGDVLVYSNGVERGCIRYDGASVVAGPYFSYTYDGQDTREIVEFPLVEMMHFFNGAMYGASPGEIFVYGSEPYKPGQYDQVEGYLTTNSPIRWVESVTSGLLIGTDAGVVGYHGHGIGDFVETQLTKSPPILCSGKVYLPFGGSDSGAQYVMGVLVLTNSGIIFITEQFEVRLLSDTINLNWDEITTGAFGATSTGYIFSGGTMP